MSDNVEGTGYRQEQMGYERTRMGGGGGDGWAV